MTKGTAHRIFLEPSPAMDWSVLSVADDLKAFEQQVELFEGEAATWRAGSIAKLSRIDLAAETETLGKARLENELRLTMAIVEDSMKVHSQPFHANPDVASKVRQISQLSTAAGRFVRKLLRRIERIRVAQHAVHVDLYYGLLALQSELEGNTSEGERFRDPAKLGASLRSQLA